MKTNRRGFLGMFGAAAVAGPSVAEANMSFLNAAGGGLSMDGVLHGVDATMVPSGGKETRLDWAKQEIKLLIGKTKAQRHREKMRTQVYQYDPNIAVLRSVSAIAKIRISRDTLYEKQMSRERDHLEGVINGWW